MTLFGTSTELYDLSRSRPAFTVIPISPEHFDMLADPHFLDLLSALDIK